jgi:hypothetical protein
MWQSWQVLKGGAAEFLADVITRRLGAILNNVAGDAANKPKRQLELVNELRVLWLLDLGSNQGPTD